MRELKIIYLLDYNNSSLYNNFNIKKFIQECWSDKYKNSCLSELKEENNNYFCFFNSKFKNYSEKIMVRFLPLKLCIVNSQEMQNYIKDLIYKAFDDASKISEEPMDNNFSDDKYDKVYKLIELTFNNYYSFYFEYLTPILNNLDNSNEKNIIDFATEIFCRIITAHILSNGNKRFGTALLSNMLYSFGYYLKYTKSIWTNWEKHAKWISETIIFYENNKDINLMVQKVKDKILEQIVISLNFL